MYKFLFGLFVAAFLSMAGCDAGGSVDDEEGSDVKAPGVDITISVGEGIGVKAPGVDVKVSPGEGVDVRAPGVDVRANESEGVDVNAPGVGVKIKPKNEE